MNLKKVCLGVTTLIFFVSCGKKQSDKEQVVAEYPTTVVKMQNAELESTYAATVKGQEDIEIRPRIDGFIDAIYVDEGSVVRKGQSLFKINSPQAEQAYTSAKAAVNSAEAQVNTAKLNVDRIKPLVDKGIVSVVQYQTYVNAYESAKAALSQAQAQLTNAQATLGWTNVTSPVDGIVGTIPYRQGSLVNSANALTTVANTSNVYVYFSLNEKDMIAVLKDLEGSTQSEKIKNMPEVSLILANGTVYPEKGKVATITGQVNVTTGSVNFRADFPNKQGMLKSGFSGRVVIPTHVDSVFVIPQKATFQQQNKYLTYKVQGDSAVQVLISVLPMPDGQNYAVTSGLSDGDRIVTDGTATLSNGKKVKVK
ncbi:MAG: efflux RND transporter periplasmic adaptor subunit [Dysgonomonas sp.]